MHTRKLQLAAGLLLEDVAALTPGFTGADLANLVNEAALVATRRNAADITVDDFTAAVERIVAGLEKKNRLLNPMERRIVAHHEAGHALVARALPGSSTVQKVSIIPRGVGALGYTLQRPTEDRYLMTREELADKLAVLMAGRAAEQLVFEHLSTGAADDLSKATEIARSMATHYAMVPSLGHVAYDAQPESFMPLGGSLGRAHYSEITAREIDLAIKTILDGAFVRALQILGANRDALMTAAARLLEHETLTEPELSGLFASLQLPKAGEPAAELAR